MDNNGFDLISGTEVAHETVAHHDEADLRAPLLSEGQEALREEVERLRLEVEHPEQQKAFRRTPQSNNVHIGEELDREADDSGTRDPADRRGVLSRRPVRLVLALFAATLLCTG